jgi:bifunctional hydroxylase/dehydrase
MDADVIIVGAGPAGLMLAGELRLGGADVVVLERLPEPTGESRGLGFTARTMEVFDQRGLLPRLGAVEISTEGHFGGLPVDFSVLEGAHFGGKGVPQARTEAMLGEWAAELGADVRRGHELVGLPTGTGDATGVEAEVRGPEGTYRLRAPYLVGCDGGRSTVRRAAGFDFPGTAATLEMFIADVRGPDIEPRMTGQTVPGGMVMAGKLGDGVTRIVVCEKDRPPRRRTEPPGFAEVAEGWRRLTGQDISDGAPIWCTSFGNATRQVTEYRRGRVLLAGDAAHIHLPAGGQGMNTSIQDAVNLGWKLAAVVRGAPPELLDTYHQERHPVGARLLMNTQAQGLLFLSGDEVQPLRDVMSELIRYREVSRHLAAMVSGLEIRYDVGPGGHPLLGRRLPTGQALSTEDGPTTTGRLLHRARGVLLDLAADPALRRTAAAWADQVDVVVATAPSPSPESGLFGTVALLVRPDGYVAWAAPGCGDVEPALRRWFSAPVTAHAR